jgi:hypothetical protein
MNLVRCYLNRDATTHAANALVDDEDYERVNAYRWYARPMHRATSELGHAYGFVDGEQIAMARFIVGLKKGDPQVVHHINEYKLDNRRANLMVCANSIEHHFQDHPKQSRKARTLSMRHQRLIREAHVAARNGAEVR